MLKKKIVFHFVSFSLASFTGFRSVLDAGAVEVHGLCFLAGGQTNQYRAPSEDRPRGIDLAGMDPMERWGLRSRWMSYRFVLRGRSRRWSSVVSQTLSLLAVFGQRVKFSCFIRLELVVSSSCPWRIVDMGSSCFTLTNMSTSSAVFRTRRYGFIVVERLPVKS